MKLLLTSIAILVLGLTVTPAVHAAAVQPQDQQTARLAAGWPQKNQAAAVAGGKPDGVPDGMQEMAKKKKKKARKKKPTSHAS